MTRNPGKTEGTSPSDIPEQRENGWHILVVDDDTDVHAGTRFALRGLGVLGSPFVLDHAHSAAEARMLLSQGREFAVILLDVVMETPRAGLELVADIRQSFGLRATRIILRTGQPGYAPEIAVIRDYDIDGYLDKTQATQSRLYSAVASAVRSYRLIRSLENDRQGLRGIINAAAEWAGQPTSTRLADKLMDFSAMLAHEMKSSVASIAMAAELLTHRFADIGESPEFARITRGIARLRTLARLCDFDDAPSPDSSALATVHVNRLIRDIVDDTVPPVRRDDLRLDLPPHDLTLRTDPMLVGTILSNLIDNAVKYTRPGISMEIHARSEAGEIILTVADRGNGLPQSELAAIFGKFQRAAGSEHIHGRGLGLYMARQIAELLGGHLSAGVRREGGLEFHLRLPHRQPDEETE